MIYKKSSKTYDAVYASIGKDYLAEAKRVQELIGQHKKSTGNALLDVACGTGKHLEHLQAWYSVEGLDLEEEMLALARERLPKVKFHLGDMTHFDLGQQYDAVVCLFSSIGYAKTRERLNRAVVCMTKHLKPGGVLIVEPFFKPEVWKDNSVHATFVDQPDLKVARISASSRDGILAVMDMNYTVGTPEGVTHFRELHKLALFTDEDFLSAFRKAGLEVYHDAVGLTNRGLYIGVRR